MIFNTAESVSISELHQGFNTAFSDYVIPFKITPEAFYNRFFYKLNIQKELSPVVIEDEVIGFIYHTINRYKGVQTLYNGGTGVHPDFRRKGLAEKMYEFILPQLVKTDAERIVLEVITTNERAINLYKKLGFNYLQTFKCFKWKNQIPAHIDLEISIRKVNDFNPEKYAGLVDFSSSFIDTFHQIPFNIKNEMLLEAVGNDKLLGFILFQPALGRISQLGIDKSHRNQGIASILLHQARSLSEKKELTILNIPEEENEMIRFLENKGFVNELDQYEMELRL